MNQEKMGKLIAEIRKEKGMTQPELGEKLGVNAQAVSKWESGRNAPDIDKINDLADILEVATSDLLKGVRTIRDDHKRSKTSAVLYWINKYKFFLISELLLILIVIPLFIYFVNNFGKYYTMSFKSEDSTVLVTGKIITHSTKDYIFLNQVFLINPEEINSNEVQCLNLYLKNGDEILFNYKYEILDDYGNTENFILSEVFNNISPLFYELEHNNYENLSLLFIYVDSNNNEIEKTIKLNFIDD